MKKLGLLLGMLAMLVSTAFPAGPVSVRQIIVTKLNAYEGKYVTAFYLSARASGFSYGNSAPRINRVLQKSAPVKIIGGKAAIPRKTVIESGFNLFNYVKIVVHSANSNVILKNVDGSTPPGVGQNSSSSSRYIKGIYIATSKISPVNSPVPATINP